MPDLHRVTTLKLTKEEQGWLHTSIQRDLANRKQIETEQGWDTEKYPNTVKLVEKLLLEAYESGQESNESGY